MPDDYFQLLRRMPVFGGLNDQTLQLIVQRSRRLHIEAGSCLCRQGEPADSMFVLEQGQVSVERLWAGQPIVLGQLKRGDCIGEMALIDLMPRSATVRAEVDCQAIEITVASLHQLYKQDLEQYAIIMMNMGREVSRRLRMTDQRLFELEQMTQHATQE